MIDVRSADERHGRLSKLSMPHIQFGPDGWTGRVDEEEIAAFAERVKAVGQGTKPVALLCQQGVRSGYAADALKRHGLNVTSVVDGYLGNGRGPGWKAWE